MSISTNGLQNLILAYQISVLSAPDIQIAEIMVDPPQDMNGDAVLDPFEDQYIELSFRGPRPLNLQGWTLGDDDGKPFEFPDGSLISSASRVTLFGGGVSDARSGRFSAGGRIGNGLAESDRLLLVAPSGPDTLIDLQYRGGRAGASLVRDPGLPGEWVPHNTVSARSFSPGLPERLVNTQVSGPVHTTQEDTAAVTQVQGPTPNPFNARTIFGFHSPGGFVQLSVYNLLGQPVRYLIRGNTTVGHHRVVWDGKDDKGRRVGSGLYLLRIQTDEGISTVRMALMK